MAGDHQTDGERLSRAERSRRNRAAWAAREPTPRVRKQTRAEMQALRQQAHRQGRVLQQDASGRACLPTYNTDFVLPDRPWEQSADGDSGEDR